MPSVSCHRSWKWGLGWTSLLVLFFSSSHSVAQTCSTSSEASALCRNNFAIDLYQGPVLAPSRVLALGGAYAAMASGVDGLGQNTASAAVRTPYSFNTLDYDLDLSLYLPGAFGKTDFDNRGEVGFNAFTFFYSLGAQAQWGDWGVATLADFQRYTLTPKPESQLPPAVIQIGRLRVAVGSLILDHQATVGVGVRGVRATVDVLSSSEQLDEIFLPPATNLLTMFGVSPEVGIVVHPDQLPWRVGVTYRLPVSASGPPDTTVEIGKDGVRRAAGLALPSHVEWPWELEAGVALSIGPRPLNPRWIDPRTHEAVARRYLERERLRRQQTQRDELSRIQNDVQQQERARILAEQEQFLQEQEEKRLANLESLLKEERRARYENWPRPRILVLAGILLTGTTKDGVGLQSFLRQEDVASGDQVTFQPRLGIEGEPIINRLIARVGTYIEPSRYQAPKGPGVLSGSRQHFTFGLEIRVFETSLGGLLHRTNFTLNLVGDLAPRYQNMGLSIGTWH